MGPLVDKSQFERVMAFIAGAKEQGIEILAGGARKGDKGQFIQPTAFLNPDTNSNIYREEIFGPVLSIKTFKTEQEAIEMANSTVYGLSG